MSQRTRRTINKYRRPSYGINFKNTPFEQFIAEITIHKLLMIDEEFLRKEYSLSLENAVSRIQTMKLELQIAQNDKSRYLLISRTRRRIDEYLDNGIGKAFVIESLK